MKLFTEKELSEFNGQNGKPAYFAYMGKVYDVTGSKLWKNGRHVNKHPAGSDLTTDLFAAPHGNEVMTRFPVIGELVTENPNNPIETPSKLVALILQEHPHPVTVHFPIALNLTAALFSILSLIIEYRPLEIAGYLNTIVSGLITPFTIITGYLSWKYNYQKKPTRIFKGKIWLSVTFSILLYFGILLFGFHWFISGYPAGLLHWTYHLIVIAVGINAVTLGYLGGLITFPRKAIFWNP